MIIEIPFNKDTMYQRFFILKKQVWKINGYG